MDSTRRREEKEAAAAVALDFDSVSVGEKGWTAKTDC